MSGRMKPTLVQLPDDLLQRLDHRARRDAVSRSEVIRQAVRSFLEPEESAAIARAYREAYERFPLDTTDDWGDLESFHNEVTRTRSAASDHW